MKKKTLLGISLILCFASRVTWLPLSHADLADDDFSVESWSKTVDFYNYVRWHAAHNNWPISPPLGWHAYTYVTYINTSGLQLFYVGLENIAMGLANFTVPMQSFIMHYKTEDTSTDVITASSFLTLMAFQDNETAIGFPNSPDINDTLYSSLSFGVNLDNFFGGATPPQFSSKTTVFPLTYSSDKTHWSWGMRYTNLTAFWWRTYINPDNPHFNSTLAALTRYDELQFTYNLTINKDTHKATLTENHMIGRMRDLYFWDIVSGWPALLHYNSTGCYRTFLGTKLPGYPTIYGYLEQHKIKMSIVQYQTTVLLDHSTQSVSGTQSVTDRDVDVSNSSVSTKSDTGEKVFDASFGAKKTYKLYNYTYDPTQVNYTLHDAVTRTVKIRGFAVNAVFENCTAYNRHLPLVIRMIDPQLFDHAKTRVLNMTGANYFYIISYPTYGGYRIVHDPTYTAYYAPAEAPQSEPAKWGGIIVLVIILAVIGLIVGVVLKRRKPQQQQQKPQ